jgi:hypothetical protein
MEVEYVQTLEDHIAFNNYYQASQPWWRRSRVLLIPCLLVLLLTGFLLAQILWPVNREQPPGHRAPPPELTGWDLVLMLSLYVLPVAFWMAFLVWGKRYLINLQIKRLVRHPENKKRMLGWRRCTIGPEGVTLRDEDSSTTLAWAAVLRIAHAKEHIFFYTAAQQSIVVPRRPFTDEQAFQDFVVTARRYHDAAQETIPQKGASRRKAVGETDTNIAPDQRRDR